MVTRNFLAAQRIVRPPMLVSLAAGPVTVLLFWFLIVYLEMGFRGGPIALTIVDIGRPLVLCLLTPRWLEHPTWTGWSRRSLRGWMELLRIAVGGSISLWSQWWASEIMVSSRPLISPTLSSNRSTLAQLIFAGMLCVSDEGCVEAVTQPTLWNICNVCWMTHTGFGTAIATLVGNSLGEGRPKQAKRCGFVGTCLQSSQAALFGVGIMLLGRRVPAMFGFADDSGAADAMVALMHQVAIFCVYDALNNGALQSTLRGCTLVRFAAASNFLVRAAPARFRL